MLNEELLFTWLQACSVIDNHRLVTVLPFNEAMVCGLILRAQEQGRFLTASSLCAQTRILKSQMNAILRSLERKGFLARRRSQADLRQVELALLPKGVEEYRRSHGKILALIDRLIAAVGEETVRALIPPLRQITDQFDSILQEV